MNSPQAPTIGTTTTPSPTLTERVRSVADSALNRVQNSSTNERIAAGAAIGVAAAGAAAAAIYATSKGKSSSSKKR